MFAIDFNTPTTRVNLISEPMNQTGYKILHSMARSEDVYLLKSDFSAVMRTMYKLTQSEQMCESGKIPLQTKWVMTTKGELPLQIAARTNLVLGKSHFKRGNPLPNS